MHQWRVLLMYFFLVLDCTFNYEKCTFNFEKCRGSTVCVYVDASHVKSCLSAVFTECAPGSYGDACSEMCRCQNGGTCHHILGTCQCAPGWEGDKCESACVAGTFGVGCTEVCRCPQGEPCNHVTGQCDCPPGFTGYSCELRKSLFGKKKK